ncbi:hypothetical protein HDV64DRAFT_130893 [Trichoderma sp. TUCIM 5745]
MHTRSQASEVHMFSAHIFVLPSTLSLFIIQVQGFSEVIPRWNFTGVLAMFYQRINKREAETAQMRKYWDYAASRR